MNFGRKNCGECDLRAERLKMTMIIKRKSVVNKIFLSYLITLLIPLFVMSILVYIWIAGTIKEQTQNVYLNLLSQTQSEMENKINELDSFTKSLAMSKWVQKITQMNSQNIYDNIDPISLMNYVNELNSYNALNTFIEQLGIYIHNKSIILYPGGIERPDIFFNKMYRFEGMNKGDWLNILKMQKTYDSAKIVPPTKVYQYTRTDRLFAYIKTLPMVDYNRGATLLIYVKEDAVKYILSKAKINNDSKVYIIDDQKSLITGSNITENITSLLKEQSYIGERGILPNSIQDKNGKSYFVFYLKSNSVILPWTYVAVLPVKAVMAKVDFLKYFSNVLATILLIIGILLSYKFTSIEYSPLKKLIQLLRDKTDKPEQETTDSNEYKFLETSILNMSLRIKSMTFEDFIWRLLNGQTVKNDDELYIKEMLSRYCKSLFSVAVFAEEEIDKEILRQYTNKEESIYLTEHVKQLVVIVNAENIEQVRNTFNELRKNSHMTVTTGVGGLYEIECLWRSYNEACVALEYELLKGKGTVIYFCDICINDNNIHYYPLVYEIEFTDQMKKGDYASARNYLEKLIKSHMAQSKLQVSIERYLFFKRTAAAIETLSDNIWKSIADDAKGKFLQNNGIQNNGIDSIQYIVENICKELCEASLKHKETSVVRLNKDILNYINEKYSNPSLSLSLLADEFHMSAPQMSNYFKEQFGENFLDYISKMRILMAKKLLEHGEISVEEVGKQVGYDNVLTFRRAFKKYENTTPGKFKQIGSEILNP